MPTRMDMSQRTSNSVKQVRFFLASSGTERVIKLCEPCFKLQKLVQKDSKVWRDLRIVGSVKNSEHCDHCLVVQEEENAEPG